MMDMTTWDRYKQELLTGQLEWSASRVVFVFAQLTCERRPRTQVGEVLAREHLAVQHGQL